MFSPTNWLSLFWRSFEREERWALVLCSIVLLLCAGINHARPAGPLGPVFVDAPPVVGERVVGERVGGREPSSDGRPMLRVHVAGAVRRPGVQSLPASARVMDAIMSAGGAVTQSDVQRLNLAAHLQDGQQIIVPRSGEAHLAARAQTALPSELRSEQQLAEQQLAGQQLVARQAPGGRPLPAKPINVNTASVEELEALPGIGPAIAGRIVRYRQEHGQFRSLQELDAVKGLGIKKLQKLQPYVVF